MNGEVPVASPWYRSKGVKRALVILLIGAAALAVRVLAGFGLDKSALLYVLLPYLLSIVIGLLEFKERPEKWWYGYLDHAQMSLMVFLASSIVLFEGFICVLMFMPLYFGVMTLGFLAQAVASRSSGDKSLKLHIVPLLLVAMVSLEGTSEPLSFARENQVSVQYLVDHDVAGIKDNLARDIDLQKPRHWFLDLFPMPVRIDAGSLAAGDIHTVHTRYRRWFFTNTHEGRMLLKIADVQPLEVTTEFLSDDSYFSSYLSMIGTRIVFQPVGAAQTRVTLQIDYQRELDPAWYFQPLQRFGVRKMAAFLVEEIMIRDAGFEQLQ